MERRSAYAANKTWDVSVPADNKRKQPQSQCCQGVTICSLLGNKRGSSQRSSRAESERDFMSFTKSYFLQLTWHGLFKVKRHDGSYLIHRSKKTGKHEARTSPQASFLLELLFLCFLSSPHFCVFWWLFYGFGFDLGIDLLGGGKKKLGPEPREPAHFQLHSNGILDIYFMTCFPVIRNWNFLCNWPPVAFLCKYSVRKNDRCRTKKK